MPKPEARANMGGRTIPLLIHHHFGMTNRAVWSSRPTPSASSNRCYPITRLSLGHLREWPKQGFLTSQWHWVPPKALGRLGTSEVIWQQYHLIHLQSVPNQADGIFNWAPWPLSSPPTKLWVERWTNSVEAWHWRPPHPPETWGTTGEDPVVKKSGCLPLVAQT